MVTAKKNLVNIAQKENRERENVCSMTGVTFDILF